MTITPAELDDMEKYYAATPLPKVFKLNAGVTINDLPAYVNKIIGGLKSQQFSDAVAKPRWDDLLEIKRLLEQP